MTQFLLGNYLTDEGNNDPILEIELNKEQKSLVVELTSAEEANRFAKARSINILGVNCKVQPLGDSLYGETMNLADRLEDANVSWI